MYFPPGRQATERLVLLDREGRELEVLGEPGQFRDPEFSPDGSRVAVRRYDPELGNDIWLIELDRGVSSRFTFSPESDLFPIWSLEGDRIVFSSHRKRRGLYMKPADGAGAPKRIHSMSSAHALDWFADGRLLVYGSQASTATTDSDIWVLPMSPQSDAGDAFAFLDSEFDEVQAKLSPDGRHLAYVTNESGQYEVYIIRFPDASGKWRVSSEGGAQPRWSQDGRELFTCAPW